jgi:hypothetical protein
MQSRPGQDPIYFRPLHIQLEPSGEEAGKDERIRQDRAREPEAENMEHATIDRALPIMVVRTRQRGVARIARDIADWFHLEPLPTCMRTKAAV